MQREEMRTTAHRLLLTTGTVLAAAAAWAIIEGVAGVDLRAPAFDASTTSQDIGLLAVVVSSLVASLAAWGTLALLERSVSRPRRIWAALAIAGLFLSLGGPLSGTAIDTASRSLLVVLHVIVAAVLIPLFYRTAAQDGKGLLSNSTRRKA